jgi:hypothetical protein
LVASDVTLDLLHSSVSGFTVASTNTSGTTFTVKDFSTAFQIAGGPCQDTIVATDFNFTADQRNAIFASDSIERIIDGSRTYTASPVNAPPSFRPDYLYLRAGRSRLPVTPFPRWRRTQCGDNQLHFA